MGTQIPNAGSSKAWDDVADPDLDDWLRNLPDGGAAEDDDSGDNPVGDPTEDDGSDQEHESSVPPLPPAVLGRIARALRSGADGPGGAVGGRLFDSAGSGRSSGASTGLRRAAARAGARTVAGISAYQRADASGLAEIGLSLADLEALDDNWDRAVAIADAATGGDPSSADDEDIRWATVQTAAWALDQDQPREIHELIAQFISDYVYRKVSHEIGLHLRDGSSDGANSVTDERSVRASIRICVHNEIKAGTSMDSSAAELADVVTRVYADILEVWQVRG